MNNKPIVEKIAFALALALLLSISAGCAAPAPESGLVTDKLHKPSEGAQAEEWLIKISHEGVSSWITVSAEDYDAAEIGTHWREDYEPD